MIPTYICWKSLKYNSLRHLWFYYLRDDVEQSDTEIEEVKADQHSASKKRKLKKLSVDVDQSVAEINEEKAGQDAASKKHMLKKSTDDLSVPTPLKSTEQKSKKRSGNTSLIHIWKYF